MASEYQSSPDHFYSSVLNDPGMAGCKPYDLEQRVVNFAVEITKVVEALPDNKVCNHLGSQLLRSGTSPALNYSEAQGAESLKDFIHKFSICLKELREMKNNLSILAMQKYVTPTTIIEAALDESEQLVRIFKASLKTAQSKLR